MTIWFFHSGMVVRMELWIFSTRFWSLPWIEADLRCRLDGDHARELEVVDAALEPRRGLLQVGEPLCGHDVAAGRDLGLERRDLDGVQLLERLFAGGDVDVELLEVVEVELVHLVEHRHVLEQGHARALERVDDPVEAGRDLLVPGREALEGVGEAAEDRDPGLAGAGAQCVDVDLTDLLEEILQRLAAGAGVLGAHVAQQRVGEVGDAALGREAVGEHGLRVAHIDLPAELRDPLEVGGRERARGGLVAGGGGSGGRCVGHGRHGRCGRRVGRRRLRRVLLLDVVAHDASSSGVHERAAAGRPLMTLRLPTYTSGPPQADRSLPLPARLGVHGLTAYGALQQFDLAVEVHGAVLEDVGELAVEGLLHDLQGGLGARQRLVDLGG